MSQFTTTPGGAYIDASEARNLLQVSGTFDPTQIYTELKLADGRIVRLPTALLTGDQGEESLDTAPRVDQGATVIPLIEETLIVGKRTVATGKVRLHKRVQEYDETLGEPLAIRTFDVERIVLNQPVDAAPAVRQEGETTIYPVLEEQLILTKQLILKEEVRVTRRETERIDNQVVTLRREHLHIEREPVA